MRFNKNEAWSFGKAKRENNLRNSSPGPSDYVVQNLNKIMAKSPSWKIPRKYKDKEIDNGPGVGKYDVKFNLHKNPIVKFGKEKRKSPLKTDIAGPGDLMIGTDHLKKSPAYKIGKAKRTSDMESELLPGPGDYSPSDFNKKYPKFTISKQKTSVEKRISSPGPGDYDNDYNIRRSGGITIKRKYYMKESLPTPGPEYSYDLNKILKKSPGYK